MMSIMSSPAADSHSLCYTGIALLTGILTVTE